MLAPRAPGRHLVVGDGAHVDVHEGQRRRRQHVTVEPREVVVGPQVDCPSNCCLQLTLHLGDGEESWSAASLKLHEYVHVTVLIEIAPQH